MIYGQNATKTMAFGQRHAGGPMSLDLDNGDWQFYAVGWSGTTPLTGTTRCAKASAKLAGAPVSVNLALTVAKCNDSDFTSPAFLAGTAPQPAVLHTCADLAGITAASDCSGRASSLRSFRLVMPSYRGTPSAITHLASSDLVSTCLPADANGRVTTGAAIPVGGPQFFLPTEVRGFSSTDCSGESYDYLFKNGFLGLDEDSEALVFDAGSTTSVFLLYDDGVTPPPPVTPGPPAPTGLALLTPATSSSVNGQVAVSGGLDPAGVVTLHADMTCVSTPIGSQAFAGDPTVVNFTVPTEGMYSVYAKQTVAGVESACSSANVLFTVDATPPAAPTSLSWTSGSVTTSSTIQLMWMAAVDMGSGILQQQVSLYTDPACSSPYGASVTLAGGATSYSFSALPDGTYFAKVTAQDNALNTVTSSCSLDVTVDTTAPLAATALTIPPGPTNASTLTLTWTRSMSGDLASQELVISNDSMCTTPSSTIPLPAADAMYTHIATDGFTSYRVRSFDLAGNMSESVCSAGTQVDTFAAPPASISLAAPATSPGNDPSISVNVTGVEDGATVVAYANSSCTTSISSPAIASGGLAIVNIDTLSPDGTYTFYAKQSDLAGNVSGCSTVFASYVFDTTPPPPPVILGVTGAADSIIDSLFTGGGSFTIHWQPQADVQSFGIVVLDTSMSTACSFVEIPGGNTQYIYGGCIPATDMTYTIKLTARDPAGNISPEATFKYTGSWLYPPTMLPVPMSEARAVRLSSGEVFVWGGFASGALSNQGYKYAPGFSSPVAITLTNAPSSRRGHAMVAVGTQTYIAGGDNGSGTFNDLYTYNGSWTSLAPIPTGNTTDMAYGHSALHSKFVLWGGRILPSSYVNAGAAWDGSAWTNLPTAPLAGRAHAAFGVDGDYFIVWGGRGIAGELGDGAVYKFSTNTWTTMNAGPLMGRYNSSFTMANGKLLIWGGQKADGTRFQDGALFDPALNSWTPLSMTNAPPALAHTMVATDGQYAYFRGGTNATNIPQDITFMYDLNGNQWNPLVELNRPAAVIDGAFINFGSQLLLIGGKDINLNPTVDVRLLKPAP